MPPPETSSTQNATSRKVERGLVLLAFAALIVFLGDALQAGSPSAEEKLARNFNAQLSTGMAPDFEVQDRSGKTFHLSDFRGKVVFVNFWATWCPPCRDEWPELEKLSKLMEGLPFEMVAVSQDASWADIDRFLGGKPSGLKIGLDTTGKLATEWGTAKLPETYIVDKSGRLRMRFVNVQPWAEKDIVFYLKWLSSLRG